MNKGHTASAPFHRPPPLGPPSGTVLERPGRPVLRVELRLAGKASARGPGLPLGRLGGEAALTAVCMVGFSRAGKRAWGRG